ncbi:MULTISPECIES: SDR family NAD(P)-dependent oxidoreductase [Pseudonocardia]|uniref:3-oxoacyl-[acyl-carrier-protein] reductase FabG n=2 Tax=Pseudonocardia TaxID=1847 RepID=A0A1Y2N5T6_PSEAH|nr:MULTISPECIES: SDR family oxidoreductase [Pseudonocardia]OSY42832.1 3-oxoacyl-[acyl-carrier-protein] reductase FabG [Pseudonocardia autotrophica]TDN77409.1 3-oxoacyl-[acyl-carrier protein] reductase [Pseudonocardia autotrophica]BBG01433.1 beta-ketoacyl-ACP reductase [Pseudonocardia autotrophica]GEC24490.1 beta-ketoacyl-ACP reductase [Pseudonocardia saturnea]
MGRTWVVTGGSRGIGRAVVDRALAEGDTVHVLARSVDREGWPAAVRDRVLPVPADIGDADSVRRALAVVEQASGSVDVLVQSAGVHRGGRLDRLTDDAWDEVLATNLTGAFRVARAARPLLGEGSSIINIGAVVGLRGYPGDAAYGSAKAGLSGLTQTLAMELAPDGVRVNLVVPGFVDTDMTAGISESSRGVVVDGIPLGRPGRPEEIADVVWAVAGATYMTGSTVAVDGGLLASFGAPRPRRS